MLTVKRLQPAVWKGVRIFIHALILVSIAAAPFPRVSALDGPPATAGPLQDLEAGAPPPGEGSPELTVQGNGLLVDTYPTLRVTPEHGYSGQTVQVTGQAGPGAQGVRLAWWYEGATRTAAVLAAGSSGDFQAGLTIPADAQPGPARVCAAHSGTERTAFNCVAFTVDVPPPGSLQGQVPVSIPGTLAADLILFDGEGEEITRTAIQPDGSFSLGDIPPGTYEATPSGALPVLTGSASVTIQPGGQTNIVYGEALVACGYLHTGTVSSILVNPGAQLGLSKPSQGKVIGTYFSLGSSGPAVNIGFTPILQTTPGAEITKVEYFLEKPDGSTNLFSTVTKGPFWQAGYNASLLPPGINTVIVKAHINDGCSQENRVRLVVLPNPMADPLLRDTQISFDYTLKRYNFGATAPNVGNLLPFVYPKPPPSLPLIGTLENKLDAGARFEGYMTIKGQVYMNVVRTDVMVRVFSQNLYNQSKHWLNGNIPVGSYKNARFDIPSLTLASINEKTTVYSGPVVSFLGIVTLNASVSLGFSGSIKIWGNIRPLEPGFEFTVYPSVSPYLPISLWLTLLGIGIASITGTTEVTFGLPLKVNASHSPPVWLDDPCLRLRFWLEVWIGVNYYFDKLTLYNDTYEVINKSWGNCPSSLVALLQASTSSQPRIMAQPVLANGPGDAMLSVYIEDVTPSAQTTTPVVKARFWDAENNLWGEPMAVSDGMFYVSEPAAAFAGPDGGAIVVWVQNTLTREEGNDLEDDLNAILSHQELFFSIWTGVDWSSPAQLTNDALADANPSAAGDLSGTVALAWVKDTDGDIATRTDLEVFTSIWAGAAGSEPTRTGEWSSPRRLSGFESPVAGSPGPGSISEDTAMDVQPTIIYPGDAELPAAIAWTRDLDGDLTTNGDRTIVVMAGGPDGWVDISPMDAPAGADSPTIAWDSEMDLLYLAFLVRGVDEDGITETGIGDQAVLYTGQWTPFDGWLEFSEMTDAGGRPVRAEMPRLQVRDDLEALLLFRRFDDPGTAGMYGNLALSQTRPFEGFSPPLYLRSTPEQRWMQSLAINGSGDALILNVQRSLPEPGLLQTPAYFSAAPAGPTSLLSASGDPVESLLLSPAPDPALDPNLLLSDAHAAPGSTVEVSAILRNVGRDPASGLSVDLYLGSPEDGELIDSQAVAETLEFNDMVPVTFSVEAAGGGQPLFAVVVAPGGDASQANNTAFADLGSIPAPSFTAVHQHREESNALLVSWMPPYVEGVAGYRILRRESTGDPYELVGEAAGTSFIDLLLTPGQTYFYVIQAYDDFGVVSPYSQEAFLELPVFILYLPAVAR